MKIKALLFGLATMVVLHAAPPTQIDDPEAFVRTMYERLVANSHYDPPTDIFTPRLKALFARDRKWAKGEVGCLDFMFWVNGQDYKLKNVQVSSRPVSGREDRRTIVASFVNLGTRNELHFDFQKIGDSWLLDDARSTTKASAWTLSKILNCPH